MQADFSPDGRPLSAAAAKSFVDQIRFQRGHLDESDLIELRKNSPEWREKQIRNAEKQRKLFARYTKTISDQLYSTKYRCIPEILQNADDAKYSNTSLPTLSFCILPTEIIIDSNEDGFTRANVEAICDTGQSSKANDAEATGEKGLGFKSIFGIARKVHIQSGLWSFCFEHSRSQDGLGMVTPIWTEPAEDRIPDGVGTRFRLTYAEDTERFLRSLVSEFEKLPETIIFATRNLKKLDIAVQGVVSRTFNLSFEKRGDFGQDAISISTHVLGETSQLRPENTEIRVFKTAITDLPSSDLRSNESTDIVVGLQVDPESKVPFIPGRGQQCFAFLPIKRFPQLPFLIQADFVLSANREEIPDDEWNERLLDGVADTFVDAVVSICENVNDPLLYTWMRYLPTHPMEGSLERLSSLIQTFLLGECVLLTVEGSLKQVSQTRVLPPLFVHEEEPLFDDTPADIYLASRYEESDVELLRHLGLKDLDDHEMADRVEQDVLENDATYLGGEYENPSWHSTFAALANHLMHNSIVWDKISKLPIVPLDGGTWVSPQSLSETPVYLPNLIDEGSVQISVPNNLNLQKLHPMSCADSDASSFYAAIGISSCDHGTVLRQILSYHQQSELWDRIYLPELVAHLEILFWYCESLTSLYPFAWGSSLVLAADSTRICRKTSHLFFQSQEPYHAYKLLQNSRTEDISALGFGFLEDSYMNSSVQHSIRGDMTWRGFLERLGIRYYPPLQLPQNSFQSAHLHPILGLLAKDNPDQFVGNLHAHWSESYSGEVNAVRKTLKDTLVRCQGGQLAPLKETLLPSPDVVRVSGALFVETALPFLKLAGEAMEQGTEQWKFLKYFGVICGVDLDYYFAVLEVLSRSDNVHLLFQIQNPKAVYREIYQGIAKVCRIGDEETLRNKFETSYYIFIPDSIPKWCAPVRCVWDGPSILHETPVLRNQYNDDPDLKRLFAVILQIGNGTFEHLNRDIFFLRNLHPESMDPGMDDIMVQYYETLSAMLTTPMSIRETLFCFENEGLIYANGRWHKPSTCIWNNFTEMVGWTALEQIYPRLREFFVKKLGVVVMTATVLAKELINASKSSEKQLSRIRDLTIALGQALSTSSNRGLSDEVLEEMKRTAFLPVENSGQLSYHHSNGDFLVQDNERYSEAFRDKINLLVYTPVELTSLDSLYTLLGLQDLYLSKNVETKTTVNSSVRDDVLTNHMRERAYALSCCANFYHSPSYYNRSVEIHELLCNAEVFVSDDMWTNLSVMGYDFEIRSDRALVKMERSEQMFTITVPGDETGLYSCYRTELPSEIAGFLGIENDRAEKPIYRILNDEEMGLDDIMKDEDIPNYDWFQRPPPLPSVTAISLRRTREDQTSELNENQGGSVLGFSVIPPIDASSRQDFSTSVEQSMLGPTPYASGGSTLQTVLQQRDYQRLLKSVVRQARRVVPSTHQPELSLGEINEALDEIDSNLNLRQYLGLGYGDASSFEQKARIGAAGELFVFERLHALGIPGFDLDNWRSRIRAYVNVHPEYTALRNWPGRETADFMYSDSTGQFDHWLRLTCKYPFPTLSPDVEIQYLIEVKTTVGPCSSPFFMSKNQHQLMKDYRLGDGEPTTRRFVYVIMRVHGLLGSNISLELYVDPWRLKDDVLEFVADPWKVIPGEPRSLPVAAPTA